MAALVDPLLARVSVLLQDVAHTRWPLAELLNWLNDGQREVVLRKPNAYVVSRAFALAYGTKQVLPADAVLLVDVVRNLSGKAIRQVERAVLDAQNLGWHDQLPATAVQHFCYTPLDPKHFYVYPPNNGTGQVELAYSALPPDCVLGGALSLDEIYQSPLVDYVMYRAYSKDSEQADTQRLILHYAAFDRSLGGKAQLERVPYPATPSQG
jgi:hypothetical protein